MNMLIGRNSATGSHGNPSNGGCVTMTDNTPQFRFYQNDHLGSVRAVVKTNGEVLQRNAYYPFGGLYQADATDDTYRYKYNGKELDRTFGHNMYDYGARWQDPYLGLFTTIDPLAEKYYHLSPYAYCANNPVNAVDPDGRDSYFTYSGKFLFTDGEKTDNIIIRDTNILKMGKPAWHSSQSQYIDTPIWQTTLSADAYSNFFFIYS